MYQDMMNNPETCEEDYNFAKKAKEDLEALIKVRERMMDFTVLEMGFSAVHPGMKPQTWRLPYGLPGEFETENPCRQDLKDKVNSEEEITAHYCRLANKCQHHSCLNSYCLKTVKKDGVETTECRFKFPKETLGFVPTYADPENSLTMSEVKREMDANGEPTLPKGAEFGNDNGSSVLNFVRNHPVFNEHIRELSPIWGACVVRR